MTETTITIRLTPKAAKNEIRGWATGPDGEKILKVSVTAAPENGKANKALIALLAKTLRISKSSVTITRGATDRLKTICLENLPPESLENLPDA